MPYRVRNKDEFSNYWFSSSNGHTVLEFNSLTKKKNIDLLEEQGGFCIVYTHFASGYVDKYGNLNKEFKNNVEYIAKKNGWFVSASQLLDFLIYNNDGYAKKYASALYLLKLDIVWFISKITHRIRFKR